MAGRSAVLKLPGMFLRSNRRLKGGKTHDYWNVVENRRLADGRVVQRQVLYLGEINASQREAWRKTIEVHEQGARRQVALFPAGSMPGVLKNAIDWLSRPPADIPRVFGNRPVAIIGASPGGFGTVLAQNAWLPVVRTLGMRPWFGGRLMVSRAGNVFDQAGELVDDTVREQLRKFVRGFSQFVQG